jgi:hypothetical protein
MGPVAADASGGGDEVAGASSVVDAEGAMEDSVDAPVGAGPSTSAEVDGGGSDVGALSRRVHAARTSATDAARIRECEFTTRQGKPAFVLMEHRIVSLLMI